MSRGVIQPGEQVWRVGADCEGWEDEAFRDKRTVECWLAATHDSIENNWIYRVRVRVRVVVIIL